MKTINALIIKNKKLLVVKKNDYWVLPGGKLKPDEDDFSCLRREIEEELPGTNLIVGDCYKTFEGITPKSKEFLESKCYFCEVEGKIGKPSKEICSKEFVDFSYINLHNFSETTKKIISELFKGGLIG